MLAAPIKFEDYKEIRLANQSADLIELRLDLFQPKDLVALRKACKKPVIFTLKNLEASSYLECEPDYLDLPVEIAEQAFPKIREKYPEIKLIASYHNEKETPDLGALFKKMQSCKADFYKMATFANSSLDALRMLLFAKQQRCIGLCMGELGTITRILSPVFQIPFTYAPISQKHETASGQITLQEHVALYHHRSLSSKTKVFGLIGDPVSKSPSHKTHNFAFRELGIDAVYVKIALKPNELTDFFDVSKKLNFQGLSVTMPLKQQVLPFLKEQNEEAINTLRFKEHHLEGCNTDGEGALNALEKRILVRGKKIVLLGAGGAAIGIAKQAKKRGADLIILNRTREKAQLLAKLVQGKAYSLDEFPIVAKEGYDILINCTSVGMGEDRQLPIKEEDLLENRVVMDIISNPKVTPLLAAAKQKNCLTIEGMEMFMQQAILQFCFWFHERLT